MPAGLEPLAQSVLNEAVRNAAKHARPTEVTVRLGREEGAFWMEVVNDGVTSSTRRAGMGLRLAAVEALQSNGVVEFGEREPGTWQVRLVVPVDPKVAAMAELEERSPERLRVLVVDDHDVVHWGFRLMLTQQAWVERCVSAHSGSEALQLATRYRPHVALVDLFIGEESGAEICERLRAAEPGTRVLLFSGAGGSRRRPPARPARRGSPTRTGRPAGSPAPCGWSAWARPCSSATTARARSGSPIASGPCWS